jgi:hypothetical protein
MPKSLHFHFYDAGAYEGETEHRFMVNFYSVTDGEYKPGQSSLVRASEWPKFRGYLEQGGWTHKELPQVGKAKWYEWRVKQ